MPCIIIQVHMRPQHVSHSQNKMGKFVIHVWGESISEGDHRTLSPPARCRISRELTMTLDTRRNTVPVLLS